MLQFWLWKKDHLEFFVASFLNVQVWNGLVAVYPMHLIKFVFKLAWIAFVHLESKLKRCLSTTDTHLLWCYGYIELSEVNGWRAIWCILVVARKFCAIDSIFQHYGIRYLLHLTQFARAREKTNRCQQPFTPLSLNQLVFAGLSLARVRLLLYVSHVFRFEIGDHRKFDNNLTNKIYWLP